ncbi:hypothetical protein [Carboxylicivirga sp. RSCT41]|uniref:hypothetical protein n=1 Tax=Carboxylicivirga agarovorans TaxID=3417570 RepID=UPI003D332FF5
MKILQLILLSMLCWLATTQQVYAQAPVTDIGAGIQRQALWAAEKGILSKMSWYNLLIKALNGDIKGLTGELLGIDQQLLIRNSTQDTALTLTMSLCSNGYLDW